jgi:Fur family ferric uptake transcriptional regulator
MLRDAGMKVTRSRLAILDLLAERQTHMSADEITDTLRGNGFRVDRVTVYRNLDRLLDAGILATVHVSDRAMHVGLRSNPGSPHHHFIVCTASGRVSEIDSRFLNDCWDRARERIRAATGWELTGHVLQFVGISPQAQAAGGSGSNRQRAAQ